MSSFLGKMLFVDLTNRIIEDRTLPKKWVDLYAGQKGLGARLLMEDFSPQINPLAPENKIVLTTSVMGGTIVSCSSKLAITTKSPLTGTITDGSVGGHIGAELKYAGYDALTITGRAESLAYLYITPDTQELRDVSPLKGRGAFDTEAQLREMIGDEQVKCLVIGPAGENLVSFSCICSERYRQLGRGGIGAVMGSKNLKAIAIRGWLDIRVADIDKCLSVAAKMHEKDAVTSPDNEIYEYGTPVLVNDTQESGVLPTRNFQRGRFEDYEQIDKEAFKSIRTHKKACFSCAIACGNFVQEGNSRVEGPEYETIGLCGSSLGISNREKLIELNAVCDDLGLDTISTGGTLAYMMEMTERGLHDFDIRFGEAERAIALVHDIAHQKGLGKDAALGSKKLSEKYGKQEYAIQVKGQEVPAYDPRGSWGMGIAYVTAPRGGCHMSCFPIAEEAWGPLDPFTFEGKAQLVVEMQNAQFAKFSMGICDFWDLDSETLGKLFELTYGGQWPKEKVDKTGERIFNLQRMFNVMTGFSNKEDILPERFYQEPLKDGPPKDILMPKEDFIQAMGEYYALRGWDEWGRPTVETLSGLDIEDELIEEYQKALSPR